MNTPTVGATFVTFAELKMTYLSLVIGTDVFFADGCRRGPSVLFSCVIVSASIVNICARSAGIVNIYS